jgi:hypothetical protein
VLDPYLLPFIKKYHWNDQYVFWPDQTSAHYAKEVIDWLNSKKIEFVPKYLNPANAPKTRPIEDFWGLSYKSGHLFILIFAIRYISADNSIYHILFNIILYI